ncbi:MAG: hypothetical protein Q7W45_16810 [Bacteroidota bacterium]|nr:hypothetical protein [Bacteroidota bacterium]MDP3145325.1 hypothetical protein [Bacteroidota bacterium]
MRKEFFYIIFFISIAQNAFCQVKTVKPVKTHSRKTNLGIGGGVTKSVLFLTRNVKENNDAFGFNGSFIYGGENIFRGSLEYTYYRKIDIQPTWFNIKAYTIEANVHVLARFKKTKSYFYPLFGLSYNSFSGFFTGKDDFLKLSDKYKTNEIAKTNWLGFNVGAGYEHYFKQISVFGEYKMRVGKSDGQLQINIMDVCFSCGLRYNIRVPSIYKIFSGTKSRYLLESKEGKK